MRMGECHREGREGVNVGSVRYMRRYGKRGQLLMVHFDRCDSRFGVKRSSCRCG